MSKSIRVVVISEEACEREKLARALNDTSGVAVVAEVSQVCRMGRQACLCAVPAPPRGRQGARLPVRSTQTGRQAGQVDADCVVLDIDRYPLAGTLGLAQARGTFPDACIIILGRSIHPRYLQFLKESGASCCIDKDDGWCPTYDKLASLFNAVGLMTPRSADVDPTRVLAQSESVYNLRRIEELQSVG